MGLQKQCSHLLRCVLFHRFGHFSLPGHCPASYEGISQDPGNGFWIIAVTGILYILTGSIWVLQSPAITGPFGPWVLHFIPERANLSFSVVMGSTLLDTYKSVAILILRQTCRAIPRRIKAAKSSINASHGLL